MLLFSLFYNIIQDFTILNIKCSYVWVITVPTVDVQTPFMFARYFYWRTIPFWLYVTEPLAYERPICWAFAGHLNDIK
jgi:hypothetical protein